MKRARPESCNLREQGKERCKSFSKEISRWLATSFPPHDLMSHRQMLRVIEADTLLFGGEPEQQAAVGLCSCCI
jgi:hypothetical protein